MQDFNTSTNVFPSLILPDDVYVYDSPSSHRMLPASFGGHNSASNNELANVNDMQARPNLENRFMDPDESAVYQEALQVCIFGPLRHKQHSCSCPANHVTFCPEAIIYD